MLQLERVNDNQEALRLALEGHQAQVWTALPGIIESFDAGAVTCVIQPAIKAQVRAQDGSLEWVPLPLLLDCPVVFPRGGGCTLTFPIAQGDECLVVFSSRCIDAWYTAGGVQVQSEFRMHDLSDGFALPGPFSQSTKISNISTGAAQLRSNDGEAYLQLNPTSHEIDIVTQTNWSANVGGNTTINVTGNASITAQNVAVNATSSASVTAPSISLGASAQALLSLVTSAFTTLFNSHTHASSGAGVPNQQMGSSHLTSTIKGG
ncbi:hypothetical protein FHX57_006735 [Paraburkholderia tropica]|uniref:Gp138 family membrane-puncturing spike protein n=1 Tax=Paraburkholderia tropica TaxID=92647 RepID=UPI00161D3387|nr:Gp138 family membrane-puncturing spike protein [Paraburkholderia tropica]MBB3004353.1 hypothetical protein [Paraburkholderia tropica]